VTLVNFGAFLFSNSKTKWMMSPLSSKGRSGSLMAAASSITGQCDTNVMLKQSSDVCWFGPFGTSKSAFQQRVSNARPAKAQAGGSEFK